MANYTLIAYKSDNTDYCRGCEMDRWSSDFQLFCTDDLDELAREYFRIKQIKIEQREAEYEITFLIDGVEASLEYDDALSSLNEKVVKAKAEYEAKAKAKQEADAKVATQLKIQQQLKQQKEQEAKDRLEYARLTKKFQSN